MPTQNTPLTASSPTARSRKSVRTARARTAPPPALPQPRLLRWLHGTVLWQAAALAGGALLGAGQVYGGAAPFGLALLIGSSATLLPAAALGFLAGTLLFQPFDMALRLLGGGIGVLTARMVCRQLSLDGFWPGALTGVGVLLTEQLLVSFAGGADTAGTLCVLCTAVLAPLLGAGLRQYSPAVPHGVCLRLMAAAACLQRFCLPGFAPGLAGTAFSLLCCACAGTPGQTGILAVLLTAAVAAATPSLGLAALYAGAGAVAAALLCAGDRLPCAGMLAAGCVLGTLGTADAGAALTLSLAAGAGVLAFLLCPEGVLRAVFPQPAPPACAQSLTAAARRLSNVADTLSDVAETVNAVCSRQMPPRGEGFDLVVEYTAQHLCRSCARRTACWVQGYSTVMDGLYVLRGALEQNGRAVQADLPGQLSACVRPAELCACMTHGYRLWCSRRQTRARAELLRTALTEQYSAVAQALAQMSARLSRSGLPDPRREARVRQLFASLGLEVLECTVTADPAGRMTAAVTLPRTGLTPAEARALAGEVGRICRRGMDVPDITHCRTVTMLRFGEKPLFCAAFGLASRPAPPETISGDACRQFCDSAGRAQMLLCDGMGTGKPAAVDGQMAARLTAQLLSAGFAAESAARLVNVALGLKNMDQESGATLDLLTLDLFTGRAGLFKAGAAPSFLCRGGTVRTLDGASLPMGVLPTVTGRSAAFALDAGDTVMMVSDGALCDGSDWLCDQLALSARLGHTPQQTADAVAASAVRRSTAHRDDITVAVLRLDRRR